MPSRRVLILNFRFFLFCFCSRIEFHRNDFIDKFLTEAMLRIDDVWFCQTDELGSIHTSRTGFPIQNVWCILYDS